MTPEFRELRYFAVVADEGNITRAAARLHVTQQALSQALRRLERRVGVALFERNARGVELTADGDVLIERAHRILREVVEFDRTLRSLHDVDTSLRVGLLVDGAGPMTGPILSAFGAARPAVDLTVSRLRPHDAIGSLLDRDVDVAILHGPFDCSRLDVVELFSEPRVAAVSAADPRADAVTLQTQDLLDLQVLTRRENVPADWEGFFTLVPERNGEQPERVGQPAKSLEEVLWNIGVRRAVLTLPRHLAATYPSDTFGVTYVDALQLSAVTFFVAWPSGTTHPLARPFGDIATAVTRRADVDDDTDR